MPHFSPSPNMYYVRDGDGAFRNRLQIGLITNRTSLTLFLALATRSIASLMRFNIAQKRGFTTCCRFGIPRAGRQLSIRFTTTGGEGTTGHVGKILPDLHRLFEDSDIFKISASLNDNRPTIQFHCLSPSETLSAAYLLTALHAAPIFRLRLHALFDVFHIDL